MYSQIMPYCTLYFYLYIDAIMTSSHLSHLSAWSLLVLLIQTGLILSPTQPTQQQYQTNDDGQNTDPQVVHGLGVSV